ncbi:hypothetical protein DPMN_064039 [Dreissena polymorpha]|uniref:Methyltransferase FkbM domain-containing protein n=1 Tax=Dreissena polymorpha TaxID=45954 RepID=A0A9D4CBK8_DREPO|nr:hypothetical protein DPMN_064039 [Dreissena polymorpha]
MFHTKNMRRKLFTLILICACVVVFILVFNALKYKLRSTGFSIATSKSVNVSVVQKSVIITSSRSCMPGYDNCVRVFDTSVDYSSAKQIHKCVALRIPSVKNTPICVYDPAIDIHVSRTIIANGNWEVGNIQKVLSILQNDPRLVFLDLGCNVGVYTLAVAKFGRLVTALDANRKNLEMLTTSLQKGNITGMVMLIWNALSDKAETVGFKEDNRNIGGLQMVSGVSNTTVLGDSNSSVAILLDDLVPLFRNKSVFIKMDIETYELKAMMGGKKFFEQVDVKYLFMEWFHHKNSEVGSKIIQFMTEKKYTPYNPLTSEPLKIRNRMSWSVDIIWIKNTN